MNGTVNKTTTESISISITTTSQSSVESPKTKTSHCGAVALHMMSEVVTNVTPPNFEGAAENNMTEKFFVASRFSSSPPAMLTARRKIVLSFLTLTFSFIVLSFISSANVVASVRQYASPPYFNVPTFTQSAKTSGICRPDEFVSGMWSRRHDAQEVLTKGDALRSSGFLGCASSREFTWHLGLDWDDNTEFPRRSWRGNVSAYDWIPGKGCETYRRADRDTLVTRLVEEGGWLILGDSTAEGHFHSLSCMLYPHVYATPDYVKNPYFDRAWPQHLYLNKSSPLIPFLKFPEGFDIDTTPLALFRRVDFLLGKSELEDLWKGYPAGNHSRPLFDDGAMWDLDPATYLPVFLAPLPQANFRTMIFHTAGHWTTTGFRGFYKNSKRKGYGLADLLEFFNVAMDSWTRQMVNALEQAKQTDEAKGVVRTKERQIIVRGYHAGHDACNLASTRLNGPLKKYKDSWSHSYNWGWIRRFNWAFKAVLDKWNHPNIHYLPLDEIGLLRPDAHVTGDCLHILTGAGVMESISEYISYYLSRLP